MALLVIGSGFGCTGPKSTKEALELLGFGPCHHINEIVANTDQLPIWQALVVGKTRDWNGVCDEKSSQVDWPGANFLRHFMVAVPDAKVLPSFRTTEKLWTGFDRTIGKLLDTYPSMDAPQSVRDLLDMSGDFMGEKSFNDGFATVPPR